MKVRGKLTKTERALLALAAAFLAALALVYLRSAKAPAGADYTITTQRGSALPAVPERGRFSAHTPLRSVYIKTLLFCQECLF